MLPGQLKPNLFGKPLDSFETPARKRPKVSNTKVSAFVPDEMYEGLQRHVQVFGFASIGTAIRHAIAKMISFNPTKGN